MSGSTPPNQPQTIAMHLFMLTLSQKAQREMFTSGLPEITESNRPAILKEIFASRDDVSVPPHKWHFANYAAWGPSGCRFLFGRRLARTMWDEDEKKDYFERPDGGSGVCEILFDYETGAGAIWVAPELKMKHVTALRKMKAVMVQHPEIAQRNAELSIDEPTDPSEFLDLLRNAAEILSVTIKFSLPNPTFVDKDFTEGIEQATQSVGATNSTFTVRGGNLDPVKLEPPVRSASAKGHVAEARIKDEPDSKPRKIDNSHRCAPVRATREELSKDPSNIFEQIRDTIRRIVSVKNEAKSRPSRALDAETGSTTAREPSAFPTKPEREPSLPRRKRRR